MAQHEDTAQGFTPTYRKLWHRDFSLLMAAHMLLAMAPCYMAAMLPTMLRQADFTAENILLMVGAWMLGVLLAGLRISNLVQRYRRKRVFGVAVWSLGVAFALFEYLYGMVRPAWAVLAVAALASGSACCLAQRALACTLVVDKTEAFHRTEANYVTAWLTRFGVALGMLLALVLGRRLHFSFLSTLPLAFLLVAWACVALVHVPFKAPEENVPRLSFDRFFLAGGSWLFVGKMLMAVVMGLVFATQSNPLFYVLLLPGCLLGLVLERVRMVREVRLLSVGACGLSLLGLIALPPHAAAVVLGLGMGLLGTRVLFRLLYQSEHCQRSSALSTYFLTWDWGFIAGLALGWTNLFGVQGSLPATATVLCVLAAAVLWHDDSKPMKRPEDTRRFICNETL